MKKRLAQAAAGIGLCAAAALLETVEPRHGVFREVLIIVQTLAGFYGLALVISTFFPSDWVWDSQD